MMKKGNRAKIYNRTSDGKEIFEGEATLLYKLLPQKFREYWCVKFGKENNFDSAYRWVEEKDIIKD